MGATEPTAASISGASPACQELCRHLSDYLDDAAAAELCAAIDAHLTGCHTCRVVVNTLDRTVHLYQDLPSTALPADVTARLYTALDLPMSTREAPTL